MVRPLVVSLKNGTCKSFDACCSRISLVASAGVLGCARVDVPEAHRHVTAAAGQLIPVRAAHKSSRARARTRAAHKSMQVSSGCAERGTLECVLCEGQAVVEATCKPAV
jgi:hypothetical protein